MEKQTRPAPTVLTPLDRKRQKRDLKTAQSLPCAAHWDVFRIDVTLDALESRAEKAEAEIAALKAQMPNQRGELKKFFHWLQRTGNTHLMIWRDDDFVGVYEEEFMADVDNFMNQVEKEMNDGKSE